jgi:hypothetical protein
MRAVLMLSQDKPDDSLPQARAGPQQLQQPQLLTQQDAQVNGAGQWVRRCKYPIQLLKD